jgi:hypothetical protein
MPNKIPPNIDEQIIREVARNPRGIGIESLHGKLNKKSISRRTLQRRLARLTDNGSINALGKGRARRYQQHVAPGATLPESAALSEVQKAEPDAGIPISPQGREIQNYVRLSRHQRRPVSYHQGFLEDYIPNTTFYLSESLRSQLHELGRSHASGQAAGTFARDILNRLLIDLSWASSQLEGNTYNRLDTERLIEFGQEAEGKDAFETQMILNHKAAIEMLINESDLIGFNTFSILNLHALLSDGLLADGRDCGRIRSRAVEIGGSVYLPLAMPQRIDEIFHHILDTADAVTDPFEQAFFVMVHLPYLQPFLDVNKRVSRIAANIPFIRHNLCPLSFIDVPGQMYTDAVLGVYELNRIDLLKDVFIWAYERSCQQYVAVRQALVPPDTFRLRYRTALTDTVRTLVLGRLRSSPEEIKKAIPTNVALKDRDKFTQLVLDELADLHEGNISRFRLRPLDFSTWKSLLCD